MRSSLARSGASTALTMSNVSETMVSRSNSRLQMLTLLVTRSGNPSLARKRGLGQCWGYLFEYLPSSRAVSRMAESSHYLMVDRARCPPN